MTSVRVFRDLADKKLRMNVLDQEYIVSKKKKQRKSFKNSGECLVDRPFGNLSFPGVLPILP